MQTRRLAQVAVACAALCSALPTAAADAEVSRKKAIWGPVTVGGQSQFPIYERLGVGIFQMRLDWHTVAPRRPREPRDPADPAYEWPAEIDTAVAEAARYGIEVSVLLIGAPRWANGGRAWRYAPRSPDEFAAFAGAAARRYPAVRHWMVWSEPTKAGNWQPLVADRGRPLTRKGRRAPRRYAVLLDRTYAALKAVNRRNLVIGGNTFTVGAVAPLRWVRAMKLPSGRPPRMDLYGHNPFALRFPDLGDGPLGRGYADFNDLDTLWRAVDRHLRRSKRRPGPKIFISEYTLPTGHRNFEFNFHMTEAAQARYLRAALRVVRRTPRIYTLGYLGLYDDPVRPDGLQVERGLLRRDGSRKPAFAVFARG